MIVPFPAAELTEALAQPLHRSGIALWVHEKCAHTSPGARVLVCTALSGGDIENRLSACCRAFGPDRIVLDLQRLRMDWVGRMASWASCAPALVLNWWGLP